MEPLMDGLEEALRLVEGGPAAEGLGEEVRREAAALLSEFGQSPPPFMEAMDEPELWAAAALHRAALRLGVRPRATAKQLAARAGVRENDLSRASLTIDALEEVGTLLYDLAEPAEGPVPADAGPAPVYRLRIDLREVRPPVWRRLLIPGNATLRDLHHAIQAAFGWHDQHLWSFEDGAGGWKPDPGARGPQGVDGVTLREAAPRAKTRLVYVYDFGDHWEHGVGVEQVLPHDPALRHPVCLGGRRAGPPDDCGGPPGYEALLAILADPRHPEHESYREWIGGRWDPEAFDPDEVNRRLAKVRIGSGGARKRRGGGR